MMLIVGALIKQFTRLIWLSFAALLIELSGIATAPAQTAAAPAGSIQYIMVIVMENESYADTFGAKSPATYLNNTLVPSGQLIVNYFGTSHVSLGNYISMVSGQGSSTTRNNDCLNLATLTKPPVLGSFTDILPGSDSIGAGFPGQVVGDGCVFPAPTRVSNGARTIGDQLDATFGYQNLNWREYAEDMGLDPNRDYGVADPLGGTACAHPPIGGGDNSNSAAANDQYATRHNPWVYFHSVIDDQARCNSHVVPLGSVTVGKNGAPDVFQGHLFQDLSSLQTTPKFMFITPNLCNDGHDDPCIGANVEGTKNAAGQNAGGLVSADLWLKHWMPMILASPAYKSGKMLVAITFDESGLTDARACPAVNQADCNAPAGPNLTNQGFSQVLSLFGLQSNPATTNVYPGGGQIGTVLLNPALIQPGVINTTGVYNHYNTLRSYEDLLGITQGGDDGQGHLGFAASANVKPFGKDVFNR